MINYRYTELKAENNYVFLFLLAKPPVFGPSKQLDIELEMVITMLILSDHPFALFESVMKSLYFNI